MNTHIEKKDGFTHEKIIVVPDSVITNNKEDLISRFLYITDMGYFPKAEHHYRNRIHGSDNYILLYCIAGKGSIIIKDTSLRLEANNYVIIPKSQPHEYFADPSDPWSIYWLHFNGLNAQAYVEILMENKTLQLNSHQHGLFITAFNDIYSILEKGYSREKMIQISNKLGLLLIDMRYSLTKENMNNTRTSTIDTCIDYMLNNIGSKLSLETLASLTNLSKSHLIHSFKQQTGYAPIDYFIHLKIQKACSLLDITNLQVMEIANQIGYDDPLYFSRIFKKIMGISPKKYKLIQKG